MTEHEALIEAILDEPEDERRRLVYADWLEENGTFADGIRAKLIRLNLQEHRAKPGGPEWDALYAEINKLERRYSWLMVPVLPPGFNFHSRVIGGLVEVTASTAAPRFIDWGEDYRRGLPPWCRLLVDLHRPPARGKLLALLDSAAWPLVSELEVREYRWSAAEVNRLAGDPRAGNLAAWVLVGGSGIGDIELGALAGSPHFRRLRTLVLYGDRISSDGLINLARAAGMPKLRTLSITKKPADDAWRGVLRERRPNLEVQWLPSEHA
jgi:uncharacterized protein (TIGR02996 family)